MAEEARDRGLDEKRLALEAKRAEAKELVKQTNAEQWAINPSVHFNEWANLHRDEFQEVADAFKKLLESMRCEACQSYLYILPRGGNAEEMRCSCGAMSINLKVGA